MHTLSNEFRVRSGRVRAGPKFNGCCPCKRKGHPDMHKGEAHGKTEGESARHSRKLGTACGHQKLAEARRDPSLEPPEEARPCGHLEPTLPDSRIVRGYFPLTLICRGKGRKWIHIPPSPKSLETVTVGCGSWWKWSPLGTRVSKPEESTIKGTESTICKARLPCFYSFLLLGSWRMFPSSQGRSSI